MPKIQVLEKQVAELIAAGEVVERPSSVIKELVENAIDAGATVVTVEIRRGGAAYMRVTDNGCGIAPEDVPTAFLRHATSKIVQREDLDAIGTLGFRGEALAAISAVGHIELLTRAAGQEAGLRYTCGGEEEPLAEEAGCPQGTTIVVRDLFFNTPARMKFLKKDVTEGNSVAGILDKLALSHPEISFRFLRDGKECLRSPGDGKLPSAVYAVYGKEFSAGMIPVDYALGGIRVSGLVSKPSASRANRSMQSFFINGRYIRSRTAGAALEEACKGCVMVGKFPACVLHLSVASGAVDVNVHPAKLEIRFVNERPIFDAVYHGVKSALELGDGPKVMGWKPQKPVLPSQSPLVERSGRLPLPPAAPGEEAEPEVSVPRLGTFRDSRAAARKLPEFDQAALRLLDTAPLKREEAPAAIPIQPALESRLDAPPAGGRQEEGRAAPKAAFAQPGEEGQRLGPGTFHGKILGEAFGTYILVEHSPQALMLIDKHAAHERLLYERLKAQHTGGEAQTLLEPVPVTLDKEEYTAVLANAEALSQAGFLVEDFGPGTVLVRAAPLLLDGEDAAGALQEVAGKLAEHKSGLTTQHLDWVYHNVACRAAMKAGDVTRPEELAALCQKLEENPQVRYCPHGRPVYMLLPRREIEKQFGRVT